MFLGRILHPVMPQFFKSTRSSASSFSTAAAQIDPFFLSEASTAQDSYQYPYVIAVPKTFPMDDTVEDIITEVLAEVIVYQPPADTLEPEMTIEFVEKNIWVLRCQNNSRLAHL